MDEDMGDLPEDFNPFDVEGLDDFLLEIMGPDAANADFVEEFKRSNIFEDFKKEIGSSNIVPQTSRRASTNESGSVKNQNYDEDSSTSQQVALPGSSTSDKSKSKAKNSNTTDTSAKQLLSSTSRRASGILENAAQKNDGVLEHEVSKNAGRTGVIRDCLVRIYNLASMKKVFPNGVPSNLVLTYTMLEAIRKLDRDFRSAEIKRQLDRVQISRNSKQIRKDSNVKDQGAVVKSCDKKPKEKSEKVLQKQDMVVPEVKGIFKYRENIFLAAGQLEKSKSSTNTTGVLRTDTKASRPLENEDNKDAGREKGKELECEQQSSSVENALKPPIILSPKDDKSELKEPDPLTTTLSNTEPNSKETESKEVVSELVADLDVDVNQQDVVEGVDDQVDVLEKKIEESTDAGAQEQVVQVANDCEDGAAFETDPLPNEVINDDFSDEKEIPTTPEEHLVPAEEHAVVSVAEDHAVSVEEEHAVSAEETSPIIVEEPLSPDKLVQSPPSPKQIPHKRKKIIESSSDDDLKRADAADDADTTAEERNKASLPFERKREQIDSRSNKFNRFENERQRKSEKRKGKEKPKDKLDEVLKEKSLTGSFRIPKKTLGNVTQTPKPVVNPLASTDVPKENLQFERYRKGSEKEKKEYKDFGKGRGEFNRGDRFNSNFSHNKQNHEQFRNKPWERDDGRQIVLANESGPTTQDFEPADEPGQPDLHSPPASLGEDQQQQPQKSGSDDEEGGGGSSSESKSESEHNWCATQLRSTNVDANPKKDEESNDAFSLNAAEEERDMKQEEDEADEKMIDPEIPLEMAQEAHLTRAVCFLILDGTKIELPDMESNEIPFAITVQKLAWWFSRVNLENSDAVDYISESDCSDVDSEKSFLKQLDWTHMDDEMEFYSDTPFSSSNNRYAEETDEFCGRSLLTAKYRKGPDDKFESIFQVRGGATYEKENFQARCTICNCLVVGRTQLGKHIESVQHRSKMSTLGGVPDDSAERTKIKEKDRSTRLKSKEQKGDEHKKTKSGGSDNNNTDKEDPKSNKKSETGDDNKEPKPDRVKRSRSPRHKHRSRSPRRRSKSPSAHNHQKSASRSRHKSKSPPPPRNNKSPPHNHQHHSKRARSPVQKVERIPRSPKGAPKKEERRRSTSAERVERFLAKTNKRPRSPPDAYHRKRHRRSRSKSPSNPPILPRLDKEEFHEKLTLTSEGKWTPAMEQRWKLMEAEQAIFMEQFGEKRKKLNVAPEEHPIYADEWKAFWEKRFQEVELQGLDPDTYNYIPEWKEFWTKRLRDLLDAEYTKKIQEIKERHGVDLESLRKLRIVDVTPPESSPNIVVPSPVPSAVQYTPPSAPQSNSGSMSRMAPSNASLDETGDDYTAKSMSISDCSSGKGDSRNGEKRRQIPPVTAGDVMSTWEKLRSGGTVTTKPVNSSNSSSTPQQQQPSLAATMKTFAVPSSTDSGSVASYDFDGVDLPQVLLHMSKNLEDQLSFFAGNVKEYLKKAEELDLKKRNKSFKLLDDEDFVVMLFSIRDRFMAMIRAGNLPRQVLSNLNSSVYFLNSVLDAPQCQRHRSKFLSTTSALDLNSKEANNVPTLAKEEEPIIVQKKTRNMKLLSALNKEKISKLVAEFLLSMASENLSSAQLQELLRKVIPSENDSSFESTLLGRGNIQQVPVQEKDDQNTTTNNVTKTFSVVTTKGVGTGSAAPTLPNVIAVPCRSNLDPLASRDKILREGNPGFESSSETPSGRGTSPFSRRNFTGNPASNPFRDKDTLMQSSYGKRRDHQIDTVVVDDDDIGAPDNSQPDTDSPCMRKATKEACSPNCGRTAAKTLEYVDDYMSKFPPGIRNLIMKENSQGGREKNMLPDNVKRKKKRRPRSPSSGSTTSSSEEESGEASSDYHRHRKKQRKRRRKIRRSKRKTKGGKSKNEETCSDSQSDSERRSKSKQGSSRFSNIQKKRSFASQENVKRSKRDFDDYDGSGSSQKPIRKAAYDAKKQHNKSSVIVSMPKVPVNEWDTLSQVSSSGMSVVVVGVSENIQSKNELSKTTSSRDKVTSVSKTFWTQKDEDQDNKGLSSISSNEIETASPPKNTLRQKPKRQFRSSTDKREDKELGEVSSSSSLEEI